MRESVSAYVAKVAIPPQLGSVLLVPKLIYRDMVRANLFSHASAMSYMTLGSIVPSLAVTFAIISVVAPLTDPQAVWFSRLRTFILESLAPDTGERTVVYLERFLTNVDFAAIGATGFLGLLIILILLLRNVEVALNSIWQVSTPRSLFRRFLFFWTLITLGTLSVSLTLGILTRFDLASLVPVIGSAPKEQGVADNVVAFALVFLFFGLLYKIGPNCNVTAKAAAIGGLTATVFFHIGGWIYGLFAANNQTYQTIYGAVAAVPIFLLWLYICWIITLIGAIVSWRVQQGFTTISEADPQGRMTAEDPLDQERQIQIRALMPLLCVLGVYQMFEKGTGKGIVGRDLAREMDWPAMWVTEGLRAGVKLGFITLAHPLDANPDMESLNVLDLQAFPTYPPESMEVYDIADKLSRDTLQWLCERHVKDVMDPGRMLRGLFESLRRDNLHVNVSEFFARVGAREA